MAAPDFDWKVSYAGQLSDGTVVGWEGRAPDGTYYYAWAYGPDKWHAFIHDIAYEKFRLGVKKGAGEAKVVCEEHWKGSTPEDREKVKWR